MSYAAGTIELKALAAALAADAQPCPAGRFSGRGIVVCAGGAHIFTNAFVLVSVLRKTLKCTLPIEVWHFGAEEMSQTMAALLEELGAEVVDALPRIAAAGMPIRDGWQLKPFALQHSRFEQVLMLDADQVPVRDPAEVFDWPEYSDRGAVFWPDIVELRENNPVWEALGLTPRRAISFESGQVLVDKSRHWHALSVVVALNLEAERLYRMIYGDKDTFLLGWQIAGDDCALVPHAPFSDERCLVQSDFAGRPMFQHRTNAKWSYAGTQHEIEGFVHLEACIAALGDLKGRWNGRVFHAPDRTTAARETEAELMAAGSCMLDVHADETLRLELLPHNEIGAGRASDRLNWWCEEDEAGLWLAIADADRVSYRLRRIDPDHWEGMRLRVPEHEVSLRPLSRAGSASEAPGLVDQLIRASGFAQGSTEATADLVTALRLLCRVEPGALKRLQQLAERTGALRPVLQAVSEAFEADSIVRTMPIGRFYRFVGHDGGE